MDESDIQMALQALSDATKQMIALGHPTILVENGFLIEIKDGVKTILRELPKYPKIPENERKKIIDWEKWEKRNQCER